MRRLHLLAGLALAVPALLLACGGDDDDDVPQETAAAGVSPTSGASAEGTARTAAASTTSAASGGGQSSSGRGSGCQLTISGDITDTITAKDELGAAGVGYWLTDEAKEGVIADDELFLILNCTESPTSTAGFKEINLNFLPGTDSTPADIPQKAGKYVIAAGGLIGGGADRGEFGVLFTLGDLFFSVKEPGTLNITRFDKGRITADFEFKATENFATGKAKEIQVKGKLDFTCYPSNACKK